MPDSLLVIVSVHGSRTDSSNEKEGVEFFMNIGRRNRCCFKLTHSVHPRFCATRPWPHPRGGSKAGCIPAKSRSQNCTLGALTSRCWRHRGSLLRQTNGLKGGARRSIFENLHGHAWLLHARHCKEKLGRNVIPCAASTGRVSVMWQHASLTHRKPEPQIAGSACFFDLLLQLRFSSSLDLRPRRHKTTCEST